MQRADGDLLRVSHWPADTSEAVQETTVGGALRDAASRAPETIALVDGVADPAARRRWTYRQLLAESERVAAALLARFRPGERVAVWAPNSPEWLLLEYGAALGGVTIVTVNPAYRQPELKYVLGQSRASGIFLLEEFRGFSMAEALAGIRDSLPALREVAFFSEWEEFLDGARPGTELPSVSPDDIAQIQYTSGTTGFPKGAQLHHRGTTNNPRFFGIRMGSRPGDVWLNPFPCFHTGGSVLFALGPVQSLATNVLMRGFEPGLALELAEAERATLLGGVPTMLIAMTEHPDFGSRDLSSVRASAAGGSPVPASLVRKVEEALGVPFSVVYAQTEAAPCITQTRLDDGPRDRAETVGRPLPQAEVKIVDPGSGKVVAPGAVGELFVRGYQVMAGYFDMPEATTAAIDAEGWLHTGDLCTMDERGYCRVEGRLKDLIIRGGENVYAQEVERVLLAHPGIREAAVVGVPDPLWGEQVGAILIAATDPAPGPEDLATFCRERIAPHKAPRYWRFVDRFPTTPLGKVQKYLLRGELIADVSSGTAVEQAGG